jgi:undecaprenyl-diphosphatase
MQLWQAIILGLVQGIAEFLPISSSGHLVLLQNWMQINPPPFYFDLFLHLVTLTVIIFYFRKIILKLDKQLIIHIIMATIPLAIIGLLLKDQIKLLFASNLFVGIGLLVTAGFDFIAARRYADSKNNQPLTAKKSFLIGIAQSVAIAPGISRSGASLFGASLNQINKQTAFEFSFLIAIPAILAAVLGELITLDSQTLQEFNQVPTGYYLIGAVICFLTSLASLKLLKLTLNKAKYHYFGWYCLIVGSLTIWLALVH